VLPVSGGPLNRWLFRRASKVICVSEATRAGYESSGRLPTAGLTVIPSGSVDTRKFHQPTETERSEARRELDIAPHQRVVVLVGRLQRVKGQRVFLQAAAQIVGEVENALFLLVGGGKSQSELQAWADDQGLADRVRLLGPRDDVPRVLCACDVGVVASLGSEGFSRAALEYMSSALPVIATRVGALPEIVLEGQTGCLVPPGKAQPLAEAIKTLLTDAELARRMGRAGQARAAEAFSRDAWLSAHESLYEACLAEAD
jgi:glycosyltransferase involved in cell wall biosynthesis